MKLLNVCKAKLNKCIVTESKSNYSGSLTVDQEILERLNIYNYEKILVVNLSNGKRFETYAISGEYGSRTIGLNGGAAHMGKVGDIIGFVAFASIEEEEIVNFKPKVIEITEEGKIKVIKQK